MKKICALIFALVSTPLFAQDLKCEKNYDGFKKQYAESVKIINTGSLEDLKKFNLLNDYTVSMSSENLDQKIYYLAEWFSPEEYEDDLYITQEMIKIAEFKNLKYSLARPKANYMSAMGEICVIPTQSDDLFFGEKFRTTYDQVFVRNLKTNQWQIFTYHGVEQQADMNYFFPDLKDKVKLSQIMINDKNFADHVVVFGLSFLKKMGIAQSNEFIKEFQNEAESYRIQLKENGYL